MFCFVFPSGNCASASFWDYFGEVQFVVIGEKGSVGNIVVNILTIYYRTYLFSYYHFPPSARNSLPGWLVWGFVMFFVFSSTGFRLRVTYNSVELLLVGTCSFVCIKTVDLGSADLGSADGIGTSSTCCQVGRLGSHLLVPSPNLNFYVRLNGRNYERARVQFVVIGEKVSSVIYS